MRRDSGGDVSDGDVSDGDVSRRAWLEAVCGLVGWVGLQASEIACAPKSPPDKARSGEVAIPLESLAEDRRVMVLVAGNPVEVHRGPEGVVARSLRCTHWGCVVRWKPQERVYLCPCHEGRYDENGAVLEGPPPAPLRAVPVRVAGGVVLVGGAPPARN